LSGQSFGVYGLKDLPVERLDQFKKAIPGVSAPGAIGYMNIWPAADGQRNTFSSLSYWSETFFLSSLSDEKFKRALQLKILVTNTRP
jgi:putative aldouronate transport system substrate-binding protein